MYRKDVLPNGIRVVTHDLPNRESISIGFWIGVGGRYENDAQKGAAHFLEHILFKGSQKYACEEIKEKIEGVGGNLNAFTSEEQTCFYAKIPSKHLNQTFDVLSDMVTAPLIKKGDVEKEKTVILEEIKMYHDVPQYYVIELLEQLVWPDHPLGKNLAGSLDSVSKLNYQDLRGFHKTFYAPSNIVIAACGNLNHDKILKLVKEKFGHLSNRSYPDYEKASISQTKPRFKFHKRDIEQMHLVFGLPGYDERHKDRFAMSLLSVLLGGNMSSRLFVEVREKQGLAYSICSAAKTLHDTGIFLIRAGVDNNKVTKAIDLIIKQLNKIKKYTVPISEFNRAREYLLGQLLIGLEDTMEHMLWLGEAMIVKNEMRTLKKVIKEFESVTPDDIKRVAREILDLNHINLAMVGPILPDQEIQIQRLIEGA
ncbi:MAG: insulinase family protein [Candidatus Omnitrophica bacterium]|nr:insulinase family protein [Candidatus Omnitrophota bacterium]